MSNGYLPVGIVHGDVVLVEEWSTQDVVVKHNRINLSDCGHTLIVVQISDISYQVVLGFHGEVAVTNCEYQIGHAVYQIIAAGGVREAIERRFGSAINFVVKSRHVFLILIPRTFVQSNVRGLNLQVCSCHTKASVDALLINSKSSSAYRPRVRAVNVVKGRA